MTDKKGVILLIILVLIALAIGQQTIKFPEGRFPLFAIFQTINFAGFTWQDNEVFNSAGGGSFYVTKVGEFVEIKGATSETGGTRYIETDVTGIDELLIIYEGSGSASTRCDYGGAGFELYSKIVGTSGEVAQSQGGNTPCNPQTANTFSATFAPAIWKFKNNFDGTWSSMQSLNVGDIFIVIQTKTIGENPKLRIGVSGGAPQGSGGTVNIYLKLYNVVRKESGFAVCKADEYVSGFDNSGKVICSNLSTIVLNFEEAIHESLEEFIARKEAELEQKAKGLNITIEELKTQLLISNEAQKILFQNQIDNLILELKSTQETLNLVQNKDPQIIQVFTEKERFIPVPQQEQEQTFFSTIPLWVKVVGGIIIGIIILMRFL